MGVAAPPEAGKPSGPANDVEDLARPRVAGMMDAGRVGTANRPSADVGLPAMGHDQ
jgi:hypothetical protein